MLELVEVGLEGEAVHEGLSDVVGVLEGELVEGAGLLPLLHEPHSHVDEAGVVVEGAQVRPGERQEGVEPRREVLRKPAKPYRKSGLEVPSNMCKPGQTTVVVLATLNNLMSSGKGSVSLPGMHDGGAYEDASERVSDEGDPLRHLGHGVRHHLVHEALRHRLQAGEGVPLLNRETRGQLGQREGHSQMMSA